jgi:predicted ATPase/DNA-binding NarL/FixJ family response regulator
MAVPTNLPTELTSFVGREDEIAAVAALLRDHRMVTLTGSGGCGKTRLSVRAARNAVGQHGGGVWFVDLASVLDDGEVAAAVASAIGVRESAFGSPIAAISHQLAGAEALVVLDNCEHLVAASAAVAEELLRDCSGVRVLATSREPLGVDGERVWRVPSLSAVEAARLFTDRAALRGHVAVDEATAPFVAEICRRLDGVPLAIELAAARTAMMTVAEIADGLRARFELLVGGSRSAVPRQRTLEASVDWSYRLLDADEAAALRRLSVFVGGWTLDAATQVLAGRDGIRLLGALVDKSLVLVSSHSTSTRYTMLETIRHFAADRLGQDADEFTDARDRHLAFVVELATRAEAGLESFAVFEWSASLRSEIGNIRAALDWAVHTANADAALRITAGLYRFWWLQAPREGAAHLDEALSIPDGAPALRGHVLVAASLAAIGCVDFAAATRYAEQAIAAVIELVDDLVVARGSCWLGWASQATDPDTARAALDRSIELATRVGDDHCLADALNGRGCLEVRRGDPLVGRGIMHDALAVATANMAFTPGSIHTWIGWAELACGRLDDAERHLSEAAARAQRIGDVYYEAMSLLGQVQVATRRGDRRHAHQLLTTIEQTSPSGHVVVAAMVAVAAAYVALVDGDTSVLGDDLDTQVQVASLAAHEMSIEVLVLMADLAAAGSDVRSEGLAARALELATSAGSASSRARATATIGRAAVSRGDVDAAERAAHDALALAQPINDRVAMIEALEVLATVHLTCESPAPAIRLAGAAERARVDDVVTRTASNRVHHEHLVERLRGNDPDGFADAWSDAALLPLETAVEYARRGRGQRSRPSAGWGSLTPTEQQVAKLVADGLTNPEIAEQMFVARSTIKAHVSSILRKLNASTRSEIASRVGERRAGSS